MPNQQIDVVLTEPFRERCRRLGFAADPDVVRNPIRFMIERHGAAGGAEGYLWLPWLYRVNKSPLTRERVQIGGKFESNRFLVDDIRIDPGT